MLAPESAPDVVVPVLDDNIAHTPRSVRRLALHDAWLARHHAEHAHLHRVLRPAQACKVHER
eukprot:5710548-Lingulodinium_polyedra.AAC.1